MAIEEMVAVGRRKTAVASVRLRKGKGSINVNGKKFDDYFVNQIQRTTIIAPLVELSLEKNYDVIIRTKGGGVESQAVAARLGISRALVEQDTNAREKLKPLGFLKRDPRKKERKKYGRAGARKRFQFSKR